MFPIGDDDIRGAPAPFVTWAIVLISVLVFLYELTLPEPGLRQFIQTFGVVPVEIMQGRQLFALFTSMFLHGGWLHLTSNMAFLLVFGDNIEAVLGKLGYILFYVAGGVGATLAYVVINAGRTGPSIGASGAVTAVLGAYLVMFPKSQVRALVVLGFFVTVTRITAVIFLGVWFIMQFLNGVASLGVQTAESGGVAYWAHIGGFVFGLLIGFLLRGRAQRAVRRGV